MIKTIKTSSLSFFKTAFISNKLSKQIYSLITISSNSPSVIALILLLISLNSISIEQSIHMNYNNRIPQINPI